MTGITPEPGPGTGEPAGPRTRFLRVDSACDRYEAAWRGGHRPHLEQFVDAAPEEHRSALLRELLPLELELRGGAGERPTPEDYLGRFAEHAGLITAAFAAISRGGATKEQWNGGATGAADRAFDSEGPYHAPLANLGIPGYEILEELGRGAMGVVYQARQVRLNRLCALKMILGEHRAGAKQLIRFLAEAEAVAAVQHPHVVQVFEYGDAGGRPFLAMEYLPGGSLADRLKRTGRLDPKTAAELVRTMADAVQAAHDLGIVHRDLKPGNVLFDERGRPKVTDFGLAKRAGGSDLTATQAVMGTPAYMAPEQARGETKFVGPQADVYSLGVILYECLTGTKPFEAPDHFALMRKVADEEPERPAKRVPGLPRDVELICLKCLSKGPAERYPTAGAVAADLGRFASGEPVSVHETGAVERVVKWARRKPTLASAYALGLLAVLLGGLGGLAVWQWRAAELTRDGEARARATAERARDSEALARAAAERAGAEAARQRENVEPFDYGRTIELAHQKWRENDVAAAGALLEGTRSDLRGWEWRYIHRLCHSEVLTFKGHTQWVYSASFSPDGLRVVTGSWDETAKVWDARTGGELLTLKGHIGRLYSASFSPDGSRVVTGCWDKTAKLWDARTGAEVLTIRGHTGMVLSASFSPDGSRVATGSSDKTAKVWDARTGAEVLTLKGHTEVVKSTSFSPDGTRIVTASFDKTAMVWDARTGADVLTFKDHTGPVASASFSPDGLQVVTGSGDKTAKVWDALTGAEVLTLKGHTSGVGWASFSRDGLRIVTGSDDRTVKVWDSKTGAETLALKPNTDVITSASFSPDGLRIVTAGDDSTAKVWDAKTDSEALILKGHSNAVRAASFSPGGSRVVTAGDDCMAKVWDAKTGAEVFTLKGHTSNVFSASFSPNGMLLVTASRDGTARVWNAETGTDGVEFKGHTRWPLVRTPVTSASFSPDGSRVVSAGTDGTAKVWNVKTGAEVRTLRGHSGRVTSVAFSPDGSRVVSAGIDGTAKVWNVKTGAEVLTLKGHTNSLTSASFSPDSSRVVTAGGDMTARVWDAKTGAGVVTLKGHARAVVWASFSPDGLRVVTGSRDKTAKVWDAKTGADVLTLKGHSNDVNSASFSLDGSRVVTASSDGTARLWDARPISRELRAGELTARPGTLK